MQYHWIVSPVEAGVRLSHFLKHHLPQQVSLKAVKKQVDRNLCRVNGKVERFSSRRLTAKDEVVFIFSPLEKTFSEEEILWEDEGMIVINKSPGRISSASLPSKKPLFLVHRLDKNTSGAWILAKTPWFRDHLQKQFAQGKVDKSYVAIVLGKMPFQKGRVEGNYKRKKFFHGNSIWGSSQEGTFAQTLFHTRKATDQASLLEIIPKTGKTHQIRAHLSELGYPILGDYQYGPRAHLPCYPTRHLLHAWKIRWVHPITGKKLFVLAPIPEDFWQLGNSLSPFLKEETFSSGWDCLVEAYPIVKGFYG